MQDTGKDFVLAVQAPAYPLGDGRFAMESAFVPHLKLLKADLSPPFSRLVVVCPTHPEAQYAENRSSLAELSEADDGVALVPAYPVHTSRFRFWSREFLPLCRRLRTTLSNAGYVQSGLASDIWVPYLAIVNSWAWLKRIPSTFVIDIDFRKTSRRYFELGVWSRKSYFTNRVLHDPFKRLQVWLAVRMCDLVMLKSSAMVADYGRGRPHVKDFLDAAHGEHDVLSDEALDLRLAAREKAAGPLEIVFFGRMVPYKGMDYVLEAMKIAKQRGTAVHLTLIGGGESLAGLKATVERQGLADMVTFVPPAPYGPALFELVDRADVAVAAPKVEDTPRAALDAMARGLPLVAFDIDYFRNLSEKSGAVTLAAWPSAESLASAFALLAQDRTKVSAMARNAVAFARTNTQDIWLRRRRAWTLDAFAASSFARRHALDSRSAASTVR